MRYVEPGFSPSDELNERIKNIQAVINRLNSCRDRGLSDSLKEKIYKYIRVSHVYNSNAIEGNMLSLRETEIVLENMELNDKALKDQIEAKTLGMAFDFLKDLIAGRKDICKQTILDLHSILMKQVDQRICGKWRDQDVKIGGASHIPPSWADVDDHISEMLNWYNQSNTYSVINKAAILHHWFVWIHPFEDGNGRVSRLLLNFYLMRCGYPEIVIRIEDRDKYYRALQDADNGNITGLIDLIADKAYETASIYDQYINEAQREKEWIAKYNETGYKQRIETMRFNYEVFKATFDIFIVRFRQMVDALAGKLPDVRLSIKEYDPLSLNKYIDLLERRSVSNTWFFTVHFKKEGFEDLFAIFYFERWFPIYYRGNRRTKSDNPIIKLYYSLRRKGDNLPVNRMIDLVNVGLNRDKLIFGIRDKNIKNKVTSTEEMPGDIIRKFIDQVLSEYFKINNK
jgi:Fic family protein